MCNVRLPHAAKNKGKPETESEDNNKKRKKIEVGRKPPIWHPNENTQTTTNPLRHGQGDSNRQWGPLRPKHDRPSLVFNSFF